MTTQNFDFFADTVNAADVNDFMAFASTNADRFQPSAQVEGDIIVISQLVEVSNGSLELQTVHVIDIV